MEAGMKTYTARFTGREVGAIGITYYIVTNVKGLVMCQVLSWCWF